MSILFLLLYILGILFLIVAIIIKHILIKKQKLCTDSIKAEIIDMSVEKSKMGIGIDGYYTQTYYPIFRYMYKGIEYTSKSTIGYDKGREAIGEVQEMQINPNNPQEILRKNDTWQFVSDLFLLVGLAILAITMMAYTVMGIF